ncbi:MAG: KH domain-containing protein [Bacilli bacterium]|nr:KH domain-containing protein [Bacilli bacterium]
MDYKAVIHSFIDAIVTDPSKVEIELKEEERDITIYIYADNDNVSRLIGKHGVIANALRETINIAGKEDNKFVHLHFEDIANKGKVDTTSPTTNEVK